MPPFSLPTKAIPPPQTYAILTVNWTINRASKYYAVATSHLQGGMQVSLVPINMHSSSQSHEGICHQVVVSLTGNDPHCIKSTRDLSCFSPCKWIKSVQVCAEIRKTQMDYSQISTAFSIVCLNNYIQDGTRAHTPRASTLPASPTVSFSNGDFAVWVRGRSRDSWYRAVSVQIHVVTVACVSRKVT